MSCLPQSSVAERTLCLSECVFGFLVAFIGCTGSPSCLSECVSGLFMSVFSVLSVSFSLVFSFLLLGCLLSECAFSFISCLMQCPHLLTCSFVLYLSLL